ncbi:hypothetical protein GW17_00058318, partial [Ensete ventricosum]
FPAPETRLDNHPSPSPDWAAGSSARWPGEAGDDTGHRLRRRLKSEAIGEERTREGNGIEWRGLEKGR